MGRWGAVLIYLGLIVSVGGGFLAWMLLAAESLFTPAGGGVMPAWLARQNSAGVPANALWLSNGMVQLFLLVVLWSKASYLALISLSTAMILLPYLLSAVYALSLARKDRAAGPDLPIAALASLYGLWLLYAAGPKYLLLSALLYAPGAALYLLAKQQRAERPFSGREWLILAALLLLALLAGALLLLGRLPLSEGSHEMAVNSEVGRLRKVLVCRPGLAQKRLTPANCHELLFDDVLWVAQARNDHDAFSSAMVERGVEVLELHELLADTVAQPEGARPGCSTASWAPASSTPRPPPSCGPGWKALPPEQAGRAPDRRPGARRAAIRGRRPAGPLRRRRRPAAAAPAQHPVQPRQQLLDRRRRGAVPHVLAGAPAGDAA